jgi:hypothetical protein
VRPSGQAMCHLDCPEGEQRCAGWRRCAVPCGTHVFERAPKNAQMASLAFNSSPCRKSLSAPGQTRPPPSTARCSTGRPRAAVGRALWMIVPVCSLVGTGEQPSRAALVGSLSCTDRSTRSRMSKRTMAAPSSNRTRGSSVQGGDRRHRDRHIEPGAQVQPAAARSAADLRHASRIHARRLSLRDFCLATVTGHAPICAAMQTQTAMGTICNLIVSTTSGAPASCHHLRDCLVTGPQTPRRSIGGQKQHRHSRRAGSVGRFWLSCYNSPPVIVASVVHVGLRLQHEIDADAESARKKENALASIVLLAHLQGALGSSDHHVMGGVATSGAPLRCRRDVG